MLPNRNKRLARQIRREINEIIRESIQFEADVIFTVTDVAVSTDLRHCKIFYSILALGEKDIPRVERKVRRQLKEKSSGFKFMLGKHMRIKNIPDLSFFIDRTPARAAEVEKVLGEIFKDER